jgi:alpha-tubulin suppressor-like RCC1 family protein
VTTVNSNVATLQAIVTGSTSQQILPNFIAMGEQHVCLLDLTGLAFCTGSDLHGELGDSAGGTNPGTSPAIGTYPFVADAPPAGWARIAAGQAHTCAVPRYNPNDPTSQVPRCWGLNTSGQVGNNKTSGSGGQQLPALVTMGAVAAFDSSSITAGAQHSCAIAAPLPGVAYCWGGNGLGQLGSGTPGTAIDSVPTAVASSGVVFNRIYAGTYHTCAIASDGSAWCWGRDDYGQLGDGVQLPFGTGNATPVQVGGGLTFRSLSVGELYTCGVTGTVGTPTGPSASSGTIYCWGDNSFGQIGNGTAAANAPLLVPTKVLAQP